MNSTNGSPNPAQVAAFVEKNFAMQDELDNTTLSDWRENPSILKHIQDSKYRQWAKELNYIWKILAKKINGDLVVNPQRHSLIYVDNPFIIPGGRFKGNHLYANTSLNLISSSTFWSNALPTDYFRIFSEKNILPISIISLNIVIITAQQILNLKRLFKGNFLYPKLIARAWLPKNYEFCDF